MSPFLFNLILLIVIISIIAYFFERRSKKSSATNSPEKTNQLTGKWDNLRGRDKKVAIQQLQAWAAKEIESEPVKNWISGLSGKEAETFTKDVNAFCSHRNFELSWLFNDLLAEDAGLYAQCNAAVIDYCVANYKLTALNADIEVYKVYQEIVKNPNSATSREKSRQLYAKLIDKGLVSTANISESLRAPEKEQQKLILTAIQEVSELDRPQFNAILKSVILGQLESNDNNSIASTLADSVSTLKEKVHLPRRSKKAEPKAAPIG